MRILTRRIYRAFPELDRYSDEQCERFVRAARRGIIRRAFHWLVILIAGLAALFLGGIPMMYLGGALERQPWMNGANPVAYVLLLIVIAVPFLGISPVAAFLTRDWLLRRRIRYVLRARGTCMNCRYSLVGLPVGSGNVVACPECATECHVDPSLGELTVDDAGQARYAPSPDSMPKPIFFTPKRVRILKRFAWGVAAFVFFGVPLLWGGYEIWLRQQAGRARASIPGVQALSAFVEANQPPGISPDDPNAFDSFATAVQIMEQADARVWRAANAVAGAGAPQIYPEFSYLYQGLPESPPGRADPEAERAAAVACRDMGIQMIAAYRADGLYDKLREMADRRRAVRVMTVPPGTPLTFMLIPDLQKARMIARVSAGRMHMAREAGDLPEFTDALRSALAVSRILSHQPLAIDRLVAIAIEAMTLGRVRAVLAQQPEAPWVDAIARTLAEQQVTVGQTVMLEGERLYAQDYLANYFADPSNARWGRWSGALTQLTGSILAGRLGTYAENAAVTDAVFAQGKAAAEVERFARDPKLAAVGETGLALPDALLPTLSKLLATEDQITLERRGVAVLIALERFRLQNGGYPATMAELVPAFLPRIPTDPYSGKPLGYRRVDAAPDAVGNFFYVYSTGIDQTDDGGKAPSGSNSYMLLHPPLNRGNTGFDFIINDKDR